MVRLATVGLNIAALNTYTDTMHSIIDLSSFHFKGVHMEWFHNTKSAQKCMHKSFSAVLHIHVHVHALHAWTWTKIETATLVRVHYLI